MAARTYPGFAGDFFSTNSTSFPRKREPMIELIFWIPPSAGMTVRGVNWISYRIELSPFGRANELNCSWG